jgi:ubiquinone/menaquinone biosynthesis C-methylase UbiE
VIIDDTPPICDYEGSDYRTRFWENENRAYEDLAERKAIRRLLPPRGRRLLEIGAGFGRLADMYQGYGHLVLLDYSKSMLREAQKRLGHGPKYTYVAADVYRLPLADAVIDTACMVRVMHHMADVPAALEQIGRAIRPGGTFVLEFASKLHLKSMLRHAVGRQDWSPYDLEPVEFAALNFDFHPRWMRARLHEQGFAIERTRTVSHFRIPLLKRLVPAPILAALDGLLQPTGRWWTCAPSVFLRARREGVGRDVTPPERNADMLFRCPACGNQRWMCAPSELRCLACGVHWAIDDGIYDFKEPIVASTVST